MAEPENHLEDFHALPWASALLCSPHYKPMSALPRLPPPPASPNVPNCLWSETLPGPSKLRAWQWLISTTSTTAPASGDSLYPEALLLVSLGSSLNGYTGLLHGGMFGVLIDQVGGVCGRATTTEDFMTAELNIKFVKPIPVPGLVLCKARASRVEGKKMWITASLEDGAGGVYCVAETFWIITGRGAGVKI